MTASARSADHDMLCDQQKNRGRDRQQERGTIAFLRRGTTSHCQNDDADYQERNAHQLLKNQLLLTALIAGRGTIYICMHDSYLLLKNSHSAFTRACDRLLETSKPH